ncbi:MAG: protein kinase [Chloroflexi bacterium]|nr:protein kinase [Chloroflexota bacterium]MCI0575856.1 protein kinase [Chloroflexota bacterium]MCI0646583.1 protein kinase [Chloroflexota bacterium]MCI0726385.1 protein kinase [Chloroflexota bacterium]
MSSDSLLGQQLDEYRLEALLGRGGMARVYRGLDVRLKRYAAIKVIDTAFRANPEYKHRFEREAQAIAQLEHPNIVRLYRYGEARGVLYMAMEYVEGANLAGVLDSYRQDGEWMEPEEASRIIREIGLALDYAHNVGVIHRDIKPSNIMLNRQGRAILTDFGLALVTELGTQGEVFGTPQYIAPEQAISSAGARPESDLYSLGVILYEMFVGELPFDSEDSLDIAMKHMSEPPPPPRQLRPDLSPELEAVLLRALDKKPEARYATGAALAEALKQALRAPATQASLLVLPSRLSIPERVVEEIRANPLPPIPVAVETPAEAVIQPAAGPVDEPPTSHRPPPRLVRAETPAPPLRRSRPALLLLALGAATLLLCALAAGGLWAVNGLLAGNGDTPTAQATGNTETAGEPTPTLAATRPAAATAAPTRTPPPATETLTSGPLVYELQLVKNDEDSLFVVNVSSLDFPLERLGLGQEEDELEGEEWDEEWLSAGECVTVWKEQGNPRPPAVSCQQVGDRLTRGPGEIFWGRDFRVYYNGERIETCRRNEEICLVTIPVAQSDDDDDD